MTRDDSWRPRHSCGTHVSGHGSTMTAFIPQGLVRGKDRANGYGVVIASPAKLGDLHTVPDEESFIVLESTEDYLRQWR